VTQPVWEPSAATLALYETARRLARELGFDITYGSAGGGSGANFTGAMGIATLGGLGLRGADGLCSTNISRSTAWSSAAG
jgi:glutamate carboxypeptidase